MHRCECVRPAAIFYVDTLGCQVDWGTSDADTVCQVSRDGHRIMLTEDDSLGSPGCVWIGLETDRLFQEFMGKGVTVLRGPEDKPWADELLIRDLDGNVLWLGTEPRQAADRQLKRTESTRD